jgi:hypothetical protein
MQINCKDDKCEVFLDDKDIEREVEKAGELANAELLLSLDIRMSRFSVRRCRLAQSDLKPPHWAVLKNRHVEPQTHPST